MNFQQNRISILNSILLYFYEIFFILKNLFQNVDIQMAQDF